MIYSIHNQDPGTPLDEQRPGIARYQVGAYWVDAIGEPTLAEVEAYRAAGSKPKAVTMRQARLALLQAGLLSTVNTAVANMPGAAGEAARIEWEYSGEVQRDKALVQALAPVLGLNDAQLDALFMTAAAL